ncbi:MAG TPA: helix-turn-helix transcriptional regulator, partial [Thermoanaerobaculia bacterium]|nr:helix-turn-helix transcriptional regulator [Thermoanaerobaculia bacterium]
MGSKITPSSGNVFADLGFEPEEAEHLRIRSDLMIALRKLIQDRNLTQAEAARVFGVTQPRISNLVRGRIDLFSIDTLVDMLARAGVHVEIVVSAARQGAA